MFSRKQPHYLALIYLTTILFAALNVSAINIAGISKVMPLFDVMAIFYFTIFSNVFSLWFVFLLGIWSDALNGNPLGCTSLIYVVLIKIAAILNQKFAIKENFKIIWQKFAIFCFFVLFLKWILLSIFYGVFYGVATIFVQFILTTLLYAVMHKIFYHVISQNL